MNKEDYIFMGVVIVFAIAFTVGLMQLTNVREDAINSYGDCVLENYGEITEEAWKLAELCQ